MEGRLGQKEVWGWGVCALSFEEWAGNRKNVRIRIKRGDPGALVSFSLAIVHFGRALAASSAGNSTSYDYISQKATREGG